MHPPKFMLTLAMHFFIFTKQDADPLRHIKLVYFLGHLKLNKHYCPMVK
jgi:hypothetical protein